MASFYWPTIASAGVTSINGLTGAVILAAGTNITITPAGNTLTIAATGGNAITALTGDGTATGPGSVPLTLATVNANVGSFTNGSFTVNAKGLITAASSGTTGNLTDAGTDGIVVTGGTGAVLGAGTSFAQHVSDSTHNGYLSSTDWSTFNGKQASGNYITALTGDATASGPGSVALTFATVNGNVGSFTNAAITVNAKGLITAASSGTTGNLTDAGTDGIVVTGGTGAVLGSGTSLAQHVSDSTHNGYLSSTDWSTFNGKQASGNYITALTGDVTASGPGSVAATLAATSNATLASLDKTSGVAVHGVNTNTGAAAGYIGEVMEATGSQTLASGATGIAATVTLTAGIWVIQGGCYANTTAGLNSIYFSLPGAGGTSATTGTLGKDRCAINNNAAEDSMGTTALFKVAIANAATSVYNLNVKPLNNIGNATINGFIHTHRIS